MSDVERELPESQRQDTELEGGEMVAYDRAQELAEQFEDIQTATIGDGVLRAPVESIEASPNNAAISIKVDVPAEPDAKQFFLDKPKSWSREYEFVRWVEHHGYSAGDFQGMIEKGVQVEVKREDDDYELVIPERITDKTRNYRQRLAENALTVLVDMGDYKLAISGIVGFAVAWIVSAMLMGVALSGNVLMFALLITFVGGGAAFVAAIATAIMLE